MNGKKNKQYESLHNIDYEFPLLPDLETSNLGNVKKLEQELVKKYNLKDSFNFVFYGTIGKSFNFEPIIKASQTFTEKGQNVKFILCGDGEDKKKLQELCLNHKNIIFPGWVDRDHIIAFSRLSCAGIAPYFNNNTFKNTLSNKLIDYLSLGLPIISSLDGREIQKRKQDEVAFIYKDSNPNELYEIIDHLISEPQMFHRYSEIVQRFLTKGLTETLPYAKSLKNKGTLNFLITDINLSSSIDFRIFKIGVHRKA